jgi:hypothetical protein
LDGKRLEMDGFGQEKGPAKRSETVTETGKRSFRMGGRHGVSPFSRRKIFGMGVIAARNGQTPFPNAA